MVRLVRMLCRMTPVVLLGGLLLIACKQDRGQPDVGVRKPLPFPPKQLTPTPTVTPSVPPPLPTTAPLVRPTSPSTTGVVPLSQPATTTTVPTADETALTTEPADISPEAAEVFAAIDRAFADSKARSVSIRARIEMLSAVRGYRAQIALEMKLQFPNLLDVYMVEKGEVNDRETTTTWDKFEIPSGMLSDGTTMLMKKGFVVSQKAPASLDDVLDEQIEIGSWGDSAIANCFFKTQPSGAFRKGLKRARVLQRTEEQIDLELVAAAPRSVRERRSIPGSFAVVQYLTVDARTMVPKRCYMDLKELSREIYRRSPRQKEIPVESAFLEIVVTTATLKADFTGQGLFVIPKEALSKKGLSEATAPSSPSITLGGPASPTK